VLWHLCRRGGSLSLPGAHICGKPRYVRMPLAQNCDPRTHEPCTRLPGESRLHDVLLGTDVAVLGPVHVTGIALHALYASNGTFNPIARLR
jgi:hypothetical protein